MDAYVAPMTSIFWYINSHLTNSLNYFKFNYCQTPFLHSKGMFEIIFEKSKNVFNTQKSLFEEKKYLFDKIIKSAFKCPKKPKNCQNTLLTKA
jgi:hypothetical protein